MTERAEMNIGILKLDSFTVANAPSASERGAGAVIYVSNGKEGSPVLAFSNGTSWIRVDDGATAIAAS